LVSIVDMMLVLKEGRQVAFGTAKDMLEAVRRLQAVPASGEAAEAPIEAPTQASPEAAAGAA
jgi:ABC-type protease/lipase transport system fused ATPase/permease subunit